MNTLYYAENIIIFIIYLYQIKQILKTPSSKLFQLIKSLDSHEKRYFKINSSIKDGTASYVKLFDAIDKQVVYDEVRLKKKFKKEIFLQNFKVIKSYLFEAILDSLVRYHHEISIDRKLQHLLQQAEVLDKKKLTDPALRLLLKAEFLATAHEKYEYLLLSLSLKIGILRRSASPDKTENYLRTTANKEYEYIACIKNNSDFRNLVLRIETAIDTGSAKRFRKNNNEILSVLKSPLLSSPEKALTFTSLRYYYYIHFVCANYLRKWDNDIYLKQKEWVNYLEQDKLKLTDRAENYIAALSRLMITQFNTGRTEAAIEIFNKGKTFYLALPSKSKSQNLLSFLVSLTSNYMASQLVLVRPDLTISAWESVKKMVSPGLLSVNTSLIIYGNVYYGYFYLGKYREALRYLNKILNTDSNIRLDIQKHARLILLLVHFELGNYDLIPAISKSSRIWLKKNDLINDPEVLILNFFETKMHKAYTSVNLIKEFRQLKQQVESLLQISEQQMIVDEFYFIFISWLEHKIQSRSLIGIIREKNRVR
jgi:hypothetical protein